jgi:hypothetical protein
MKIKVDGLVGKNIFSEVKAGQVFSCGSLDNIDFYVKNTGDVCASATRLKDGLIVVFTKNAIVTIYPDSELVIK